MARQVFRPRSIIRVLSRTHPKLISGGFDLEALLGKIDLDREMLHL